MGSGYVHQSGRAERTTLVSDIPYVTSQTQWLTRNTGRVKHFSKTRLLQKNSVSLSMFLTIWIEQIPVS